MSTESSNLLHKALADTNRRTFLRRAGLASFAGAIAPSLVPLLMPSSGQAAPTPSPALDAAILNFALNLEYLEAQYYTYGVQGTNIEKQGIDTTGGDGTLSGGTVVKSSDTTVPFTDNDLMSIMTEIAADERAHVKFLHDTLGVNAVAQPKVDLLNSFNGLAVLAGIGDSFDPFENQTNFLLGAFIFEDVGVTAYHGAAPLIYDKAYLAPAAGILAVEAYHAATIRTLLYNLNAQQGQSTTNATVDPNPPPPNPEPTIADLVQMISDARDAADSQKKEKDQGILDANGANIVPTDKNSIAFSRTTTQILRIVYGMPTGAKGHPTPGTFFPNGLNGVIR